MAETRAEDQTALRTQNQPPKFAQLYSSTGINPRNCAPECCTQSSIVLNVQPRTQVIRPGPIANGLIQCRPLAEAPPATPAAAYVSHASRSSLQQKHTPAEQSSPPWKECVCAHGDRVRRQKPRPKRATRHAQAQAQANTLMTYYGYGGRNP